MVENIVENEEIPLSWFHFNVTGNITAYYKAVKIQLAQVKYSVMYEGDRKVLAIQLLVNFDRPSAQKLAEYFPVIAAGLGQNCCNYQFSIKEEILRKYNQEFIRALDATQLMLAGKSACLRLENFNCDKPL